MKPNAGLHQCWINGWRTKTILKYCYDRYTKLRVGTLTNKKTKAIVTFAGTHHKTRAPFTRYASGPGGWMASYIGKPLRGTPGRAIAFLKMEPIWNGTCARWKPNNVVFASSGKRRKHLTAAERFFGANHGAFQGKLGRLTFKVNVMRIRRSIHFYNRTCPEVGSWHQMPYWTIFRQLLILLASRFLWHLPCPVWL